MSKVLIGHASINEKGTITGGAAGDQTGKEVCAREWYKHKQGRWLVYRPDDPEMAERMAVAMERAVDNNGIGYCQNRRDSLFTNVKPYGWDPAKTTNKVHCDCSSLIRVCAAFAWGKDVLGNIRTATMPRVLAATGLFTQMCGDEYEKGCDLLKRGDVLVTPSSGHTVLVLSDGAKVAPAATTTTKNTKATEPAHSGPSNAKAGKYEITTNNLGIRNGAGTKKNKHGKDKHVLIRVPAGTVVRCYGYYSMVGKYTWLLVEAIIGGVKYTGFCSTSHLKKM